MAENAPRCPTMAGTYLGVIDCLGAALVVLLGSDMDFKIVDGFVMGLETGFTLVLVNVNGLGAAGGLRGPMNSNRSFPVMSTLRIVLAALEIFRHILDFRSGMSCAGLGYLNDHICYEFC